MFGKFITGKLNRALGRGKKLILSVGLTTGMLVALACQAPAQTVEVEVTREIPITRVYEVTREVPVTREVEVTRQVEVSRNVEVTREVPVTRQVEVTREVPVTRMVEIPVTRLVEVTREVEVTRQVPVNRLVTATPFPMSTIVPSCTLSQVERYIGKLQESIERMNLNDDELSNLLDEVATQPVLLVNTDWSNRMNYVMSSIYGNVEDFRSLSPVPSCLRHIHDDVEEAASLIEEEPRLIGLILDSIIAHDPETALEAMSALIPVRNDKNKYLESAVTKWNVWVDSIPDGESN